LQLSTWYAGIFASAKGPAGKFPSWPRTASSLPPARSPPPCSPLLRSSTTGPLQSSRGEGKPHLHHARNLRSGHHLLLLLLRIRRCSCSPVLPFSNSKAALQKTPGPSRSAFSLLHRALPQPRISNRRFVSQRCLVPETLIALGVRRCVCVEGGTAWLMYDILLRALLLAAVSRGVFCLLLGCATSLSLSLSPFFFLRVWV
jgi:hypothetical protein